MDKHNTNNLCSSYDIIRKVLQPKTTHVSKRPAACDLCIPNHLYTEVRLFNMLVIQELLAGALQVDLTVFKDVSAVAHL